MAISIVKLMEPTQDVVNALNKWENDETLRHLIRPNKNKEELTECVMVTVKELKERLDSHEMYLIFVDEVLVGEMNYMVDPAHLFKSEAGTAWIGITIGESVGRGKGVGFTAIQFLEQEIKEAGLHRIELGVFEFNENAHKLYKKLGYKEIGYYENFTYWQDKMWTDIRMEKYL